MTIKDEEKALRFLLELDKGINNPDNKSLSEILFEHLGPNTINLLNALKEDGLINFAYLSKSIRDVRITSEGLKYFDAKKQKKKDLWLKNAWIPILVTVATNLVISGLKWLWPLIQRWVSSFL